MHVTAIDTDRLDGVLDEIGSVDHGDLIPLLQRIQETFGYLPKDVLLEASRRTRIPAAHMYGVATFYGQFHLAPHGRHTIRICRGTACHVKGAKQLLDRTSEQLGVEDGSTTEDRRFTIETVACLGTCFLAPVQMVDHDYFGNVSPEDVPEILAAYE